MPKKKDVSAQQAYYLRNKAAIHARKRELYKVRDELGVCIKCAGPRAPSVKECEKHRDARNARYKGKEL